MSITFDSSKWSNPARARDYENSHVTTNKMVLVPASELRYFKMHTAQSDELFSQIVSQGEKIKPINFADSAETDSE